MSELQKWITSISGAVVGQMAILVFFYLLVFHSSVPGLSAKSPKPQSREVTVMLSQLAEEKIPEAAPQIESPQPAPEPEPELPEEEPLRRDKPFIDTDSNTARPEAPREARFESDRNTSASAEFMPDPNMPQVAGPTLRGEDKIPNVNLADQDYQEGEIEPNPSPAPPTPSTSNTLPQPPVPVDPLVSDPGASPDGFPSESEPPVPQEEMSPQAEPVEGQADEIKPGESEETPPDLPEAEKETQPLAEVGLEMQESTREQIFSTPQGNALSPIAPEAPDSQEAMTPKETEQNGEPGAPAQQKEIRAMPVSSPPPPTASPQENQLTPEEMRRQIDESMFNPAYLAERRKNNQNGDITDLGSEAAVDAAATETGKYKKAVHQAIGKKWHEYLRDRGDHVSWGLLRVSFRVTPAGKIRDLKIEKKEATELVTELSLRAINDAKIPPMPAEVAATLGGNGLEMHYNIIIHD